MPAKWAISYHPGMSTSVAEPRHTGAKHSLQHQRHQHEQLSAARSAFGWKPALILSFACASLIVLWFSIHRLQPPWDEAGHILNSLTVCDLLHHAKLFRPSWWQELLSVNHLYPPFVYAVNGFAKLVFGETRLVDTLVLALFDFVLSLSVFASTRKLSGSIGAGLAALAAINTIPLITWLSHSYLLDFPLVAMVSLAVWCLIQWSSAPTWRNAVFAGAAAAACCATKHFGFLYLALPAVVCLVRTPGALRRRVVAQTAAMCALVAAGVLPWFLVNKAAMSNIADANITQMGSRSFVQLAWENLLQYTSHLPNMLSPLLLSALVVSLLFINRKEHRQLLPLSALAAGGLIGISCVTVTPALDRYAAPLMVAVAAYLGIALRNICRNFSTPCMVLSIAAATLAVLQCISFNWTPTPIDAPPALVSLSNDLGVCLLEYRGQRIEKASPVATSSWGHEWVMKTIGATDPLKPVWVHISPNSSIFNVHTFELVGREQGVKARPTTSRVWSLNGDTVEFSPKTALYYDWFVIVTGDQHQGNIFVTPESGRAYNALIDFVRTSGKFRKVGDYRLPDNNILQLYRQK